MRVRAAVLFSCLAAITASCSMMPPPIPLAGSAADVRALTGTWSGSYSSVETGRHGSINFTLAVDADTAYGDVLMLPSRQQQWNVPRAQAAGIQPASPRSIEVAFVLAARDSVYGILEPYEDPECGCVLATVFAGRLEGDVIDGLYRTRNERTAEITSGEWTVRRKR